MRLAASHYAPVFGSHLALRQVSCEISPLRVRDTAHSEGLPRGETVQKSRCKASGKALTFVLEERSGVFYVGEFLSSPKTWKKSTVEMKKKTRSPKFQLYRFFRKPHNR